MEGPTKKIIPAQEIITCGGCIHLKNSIQLSHMKGVQVHTCTYGMLDNTPGYKGKQLSTNIFNGAVQPGDWCPFPVIES